MKVKFEQAQREKCPNKEFFSGLFFLAFGQEKTYLDTFQVVKSRRYPLKNIIGTWNSNMLSAVRLTWFS